uniref:(northern house mosquito) hypothetical protein n=1 Tax=Culex pipiens TaxID=7175 RepID=A0A8D8AXM8_CULPI
MERVGTFSLAEPQELPYYFLPHHAVVRPESSTTKLRVVFDASAKSSNGQSLNDQLLDPPDRQSAQFSNVQSHSHLGRRKNVPANRCPERRSSIPADPVANQSRLRHRRLSTDDSHLWHRLRSLFGNPGTAANLYRRRSISPSQRFLEPR